MARKRSSKWLSFEDAKTFIQEQGVQSRQQYLDWWDDNKPKSLSRYPQRVYTKEWNGWNDFLGTNNEFNKTRRSWRPFEEAVHWVHKQCLEGGKDGWLNWVNEDPERLPEDIPKRPDIVYDKQWLSWKHWLGNKLKEKVEAQQKIQSAAVFYVIQELENIKHGNNIFTFGVDTGGISSLKERWKTEKFRVVKLFRFDHDNQEKVKRVVNTFSSAYAGDENVRIVPNIHELCWELFDIMEPIQ